MVGEWRRRDRTVGNVGESHVNRYKRRRKNLQRLERKLSAFRTTDDASNYIIREAIIRIEECFREISG